MNEMLKPIMAASYYLGLVMTVAAACVKLWSFIGGNPGYQANNWAIGACALFLCALASARMTEAGGR